MKFITYSLSQHSEVSEVEVQRRANYRKYYQRKHKILLDAPSLDSTQFTTKPVRHICRAIAEKAIDNRQIKVIADGRTQPVCNGTEAMQNTIDHALIQELINDILCKPVGGLDEKSIVDLVKVIFILEQRDLQSVLRRRIDIAIDRPTERQATQRDQK